MLKILHNIGEYCLLMGKVFRVPDKGRMFWRQMSKEMEKQGLESILITLIVSVFMGAIMTLQTKLNTENPLLPAYSTGLVTRDCILLEFSSTILCLLLAGKVGSNMASEIGTMRITEQIDAMEIMGVNSANYLILPKIVAFMVMMPLLVTLSMFTGLLGGYGISAITNVLPVSEYLLGIQYAFIPFYVWYSFIKTIIFAFIIASMASYYGYYAKGGALEVGKSSTKAVVNSSIVVLLMDVVLTNLMLN